VPLAARSVHGRPGWASVCLVQTTAGPLAGDRIELELEVGAGASLEVTSAAATIAYPAAEVATLSVRVRVEAGGRLVWLAQPLILAAGCDLVARTEIELAEGAAALVREHVALGRHGEEPGRYEGTLRCELDGRPLLHDAIRVGADSPVALGGARAYGTLALLGRRPDAEPGQDELDLAGPGRVLRALGADVTARLARGEDALRKAL
jgi:urease accessory protein